MSGRGPLRAPSSDGAVLAQPPLEQAGALLSANRPRLRRPDLALLDRPWNRLRQEARQGAVESARTYLASRGEPAPPAGADSLVMAGHQPELFHPGVWVKNFALCGLARRHGVTALNLVVDNDQVKSTALRVPSPPTPEHREPHVRILPFDHWPGEVPYEEYAVNDPEAFRSFPARAGEMLRPWGYEPLLPGFWAEVLRRAREMTRPLVGECFASARRGLERRWGCHNLEVPLSEVCRGKPFAHFACHLLAELPRFHALYNAAARAYRARHGIRDRTHPVPDLAVEGDWLETPFWAWRAGAGRRARLFARVLPERTELRAGSESLPSLPPAPSARAGVSAWPDLERHGWKVRTRALTTTLYARLFLADLFLHGIGGGIYDELTDELARRFYGIEPPAFLVLSATLWLPLPARPAGPDDRRRLARELRDLHYNPQRHLGPDLLHDPALAAAVREKQEWVAREPADHAGRRERFRTLRELTEQIRAPLRGREEHSRQALREVERDLRANAVTRRRDYSFCLYPESTLRPVLGRFLER